MIFKTVDFNVFRKNLQDIVFEKDSVFHPKNVLVRENPQQTLQKANEIVIKPLNAQQSGIEKMTSKKEIIYARRSKYSKS